jgi:hypothetical protein
MAAHNTKVTVKSRDQTEATKISFMSLGFSIRSLRLGVSMIDAAAQVGTRETASVEAKEDKATA